MTTENNASRSRNTAARNVVRIVFVVAIAGLAAAQYALDAGLGQGGRINAPTNQVTVSKPVYTVNRNTGEMVHNRANAFNDSTYKIHQRYAIDRTEYFYAGSGQAARAPTHETISTPTNRVRSGGAANPYVSGGPMQAGRNTGGALSAPSYSAATYGAPPRAGHGGGGSDAHAGKAGSGLAAPSYRVSGGGGRKR